MDSKCGDRKILEQRRGLRPASTIAGEIARRLAPLEIFFPKPRSTYPSIPKTGQHAISHLTLQQPKQPSSGPSSQLPQSLSATNSPPPPYSSTATDEPQSSSAATSEFPSYSSSAQDEPQSSSATISEPPTSPPDPANESSQSSPSLITETVPRLIGNTVLGRRHMNAADLSRFSPLSPGLLVEDRQDES